ncbi:DUF6443 domain-containing protein [Bacteroides sp. BFG-551]|nr:DUF6443 domain-containing protein [Bacteroides sp. BFG-551]
MSVSIDTYGSEVEDTHLSVLTVGGDLLYRSDDSGGDRTSDLFTHAALYIPVLMPGLYNIVTDGASNGYVTTHIQGESLGLTGDKMHTAIDAGTRSAGFRFTDTRDTSSGYTNQYREKEDDISNDVFYRLVVTAPLDLTISHVGSMLTDTRISVLDSSGVLLYTSNGEEHSDGVSRLVLNDFPVGAYYIVSEGVGADGNITTTLMASGINGFFSPTMTHPHVITFFPTVATDDLLSLSPDQLRHEIQYYDHFGNSTVKVFHGFSPLGNDLFTVQEYDGLHRESNLWLPVAYGSSDGSYVDPGLLMQSARSSFLYGEDSHPYSRVVYDGSALNEVVSKYGPGKDWHTAGRSVKNDRMTNSSSLPSIRIYRADKDNHLTVSGTYAEHMLDVMRTTDEDGNVTYEFKDKTGRTLLSRQMNGDETHDTYTVYDNYGNVRFVLPPLAADSLTAVQSYAESHPVLQNCAYIYHYDKYNRCIYKKLPGCAPVYTVYDAADRPIFTQDGEQRERTEWSFSIPDGFGRVVLSGICKNQPVYDAESCPLDTVVVKAVWASEENSLKGYRLEGITLSSPIVLSVNYYDSYDFLGKNGIPDDATTAYSETSGYGKRHGDDCKGQQTGSLTARFTDREPAGFIYSALYYDDRYRVIQRKGNNGQNGTESVYTAYNFEGSPTKEKHVHIVPGQSPVTEVHTYTYDLANRLLKSVYQLNDKDSITLVDNIYDEVGRLLVDKRNGVPELRTNYSYNLRSWLKGVSSPLFSQDFELSGGYK